MTDKVFNTRLTDEQIEAIRAWAFYKKSTIQAVTGAAIDEFFDARSDKLQEAIEQYRNKDNISL